jgi:hypothetical protein
MNKVLTAILSLGLAAVLQAAPPAGVVTSVAGKVSLHKGDKVSALRLGQQLYAGDRLTTGANGRAALVLTDGTQLKVNYNTDITLRDTDSKGKASERGIGSIKVALGGLWAKVVKKGSRLEFDTPAAVAAVKGTELILEVELDKLCAKLREGSLGISNRLGAADLGKLQMLCVSKGKMPGTPSPWNGSADWTNQVGGATGAEVEIRFRDGDGQDKALKLEYGK